MITVFTPTYNRGYILHKLFESLNSQNIFNFEWIIVDDGSQDNTEQLVQNFMKDAKFPIIFEKQENQGKHIAINRGVDIATGDLFFIVDSDDHLLPHATQLIASEFVSIKDRNQIAGLSFRRGINEDTYIGAGKTFQTLEASPLEFRYKHKIKGDMAEVFKTEIFKKFPFPKIEGEKFCTEGLIFIRLSKHYKIRWISEIIYIGGYLEDGLTSNIFKVRKNSPQGSTNFYSELSQMPIGIHNQVRAVTNYWRFSRYINSPFAEKWKKVSPILSTIALPLSLLFYIKDK